MLGEQCNQGSLRWHWLIMFVCDGHDWFVSRLKKNFFFSRAGMQQVSSFESLVTTNARYNSSMSNLDTLLLRSLVCGSSYRLLKKGPQGGILEEMKRWNKWSVSSTVSCMYYLSAYQPSGPSGWSLSQFK